MLSENVAEPLVRDCWSRNAVTMAKNSSSQSSTLRSTVLLCAKTCSDQGSQSAVTQLGHTHTTQPEQKTRFHTEREYITAALRLGISRSAAISSKNVGRFEPSPPTVKNDIALNDAVFLSPRCANSSLQSPLGV
jgi:hypothetical protein